MIEFTGIEEVLETLENTVNETEMIAAMRKACMMVERTAKQTAPKGRSGELRNSITSLVDYSGNDIVGKVYTPLEYAPYVELGTGLFAVNGGREDVPWCYKDEETGEFIWTSGQKPKPYLFPALDQNREEILRILEGALLSD